jgi:hypothetical protein
MSNLNRGERLQIMLSPAELSALDDFRFKKRMPSRAAAVRELFRLGLASAGLSIAHDGKKSADFGVLEERQRRSRKRQTPTGNVISQTRR